MPATTTEATREELVAEYIARDAVFIVQNRLVGIVMDEDRDVFAMLPESYSDALVDDLRHQELFTELFSGEEDIESAEFGRATAQACYMAARILRGAIYHAEDLRRDVQHLFELSAKAEREAAEL